jgi:hypothetical protein
MGPSHRDEQKDSVTEVNHARMLTEAIQLLQSRGFGKFVFGAG